MFRESLDHISPRISNVSPNLKSFVLTIDSRHALPVYPNLARDIHPSAINELWIADITYIRLRL